MAELDSNIVFHGLGGVVPDFTKHQQEVANLKGTGLENVQRGLQNTESQQKIDQTNYDVNFRKTLDDLLAKHTKPAGQTVNPSATPVPPAGDTGTTSVATPATADQPKPSAPVSAADQFPPGVLGYALDGHTITDRDDLDADTLARNKILEPDGKTPQSQPAGLPGEKAAPTAAPTSAVDNGDGSSRPQAQTPGGFVTDMRSIQKELADAGYGSKALAMNPALMEAAVKGIDLQTKQFELLAKQHGQMASLAGSVLQNQVDPNEPDPQKLDAQKNMFLSAAQTALQTGLQQGVIDQAHAAPLAAMIKQGWSPQLQAQIKQLADAGMTSEQLHTAVANQLKEARESLLTGSEVAERGSKTLEQDLKNAGQTVRGVTDQASLDAWYKGQPQKVQDAAAALYKKGYSENNIDALSSLGQSEEQRSNQAIRQAQHDDTIELRRTQNEATNQIRRDNLDLRREIHDDTKAKGSASDKADQRQAQNKLLSLQKQEEPLYGEMAQLRSAINTGGRTFVPKSGTPVDMNTKTTDPEKQKDLVDDMKERLAAAQQKAEALINEKYDIVDAHGGTPKVSREDAIKNLHTVTPVKQAAPAPTATPSATPVTPKPATPGAKSAAAGKMRVKIGNQTGTIDAKDFDPKTMSKL